MMKQSIRNIACLTWNDIIDSSIFRFWTVLPSGETKAIVRFTGWTWTATAFNCPTHRCLASVLYEGLTTIRLILVMLVSILEHECLFASFLVTFDDKALVN